MQLMSLLIAFHLVGMIFWMSGLLLVSSQLRTAVKKSADPAVVGVVIVPLAKVFIKIGFIVALLTGLAQMLLGGVGTYFKQGWFHMKLTLLIVLIAMTFVLLGKLNNYIAGKIPTEKSLLMVHIVSATSMLLIVLSATLKF